MEHNRNKTSIFTYIKDVFFTVFDLKYDIYAEILRNTVIY